ncbi:hypothetical protein H2198_009126 [Neophaeococcomyces mojaviensis]|uniref:Uncharacterized protein n=1 Tax=Neophaeococcomyces mojaviensis TaxID=3383035 RepID=A0ACC2ZVG5_9EURO|nr:hypothetical protein H2198_009126 [Knufia sp. JES_112]
MARSISQFFIFAGFALILSYVCFASPPPKVSTIHVKSGQSIQAAINTAQPGNWILVEAGTYHEQLTITSDEINLVGLGAILVPPSSPQTNTCSGLGGPNTEAGICVTGSDVELAPFVVEHRKIVSVGRTVKNVLITGFEVRGFSGENIAVVGAENVQVIGNKLVDGDQYGCLVVGSSNTQVEGNAVVSNTNLRFISVCVDNSPGIQVSSNHVSGYVIGLCVQTSGADIRNNDVVNSCTGAFVDPGVKGAKLTKNHISNANATCTAIPGVGISGITIYGASDTTVQYNLIEGLTAGGLPGQTAVAVAILDTATDPVLLASGNIVTKNILRNNDLDIFVFTNGTGNVIENNQCSTPEELCA